MSEPSSLAIVHEEALRVRRWALVAIVTGGLVGAGCVLLLLTLLPHRTLTAPGAFLSFTGTGLFVTSILTAAYASHHVVGRLTTRRLALEAEGLSRLGTGDLLAALELESGEGQGSASLAGEHLTRVARSVHDLDAAGLFPHSARRWARRLHVALASAGLVTSLLWLSVLLRPESTKAAAIAVATPWRAVIPRTRSRIQVEPGHAQVTRGDSLGVRAVAPGQSRVRLVWQAEGEKRSGRPIDVAPDGRGSETIPSIVAATRYWVEGADGSSSDTFAIRPLDPLLVEQLSVVLSYPSYLGHPPDSLAAPLPTLVMPIGTRIELSGRANYSLDEVLLVFRPLRASPDEAERPGPRDARTAASRSLSVDAYRFRGQIQPEVSGEWTWRLRALGAPGEPVPPAPLETLVIPDSLPRVRVLFPAVDTAVLGDVVLPLVVEARDDIGLRAVEMLSWLGSAPLSEASPRVERIGPERPGDNRALVRPLLDMRDRELLPGDTVYYVLRAIDANPTHAAVSSDTFRVWVPTLADISVVRAERIQDLARATGALEAAAGDLELAARQEALRATSPETGDPAPRPTPDSPETSSRTMSEQSRLQDRSEELSREHRELQDEIERLQFEVKASLKGDPALERELAELLEQWREGVSHRRASASRELDNRLESNDPAAVRDALDQLAQEAQTLRDQLRAANGRLEMAALQQSLKASSTEAAELAARQQAATEALPHEADWFEREENLAVDTEALANRLDGLQEQLERLGAGEAADSSRVAGAHAARASEQMREAARLASGEQGERAAEADAGQGEQRPRRDPTPTAGTPPAVEQQARNATENLQRAAEALEATGSELSRQMDDAALGTLARARTEALQLAGEEHDLLEARPDETVRSRQVALRQGLDNLAKSLAEAREAGALADRAVTAEVDAAARAMDAAIERLTEVGRGAAAARAHRDAIEALNELALLLLEAGQSRSAASAGAAGQEARERMSTLAQQQGGVTERTRALVPSGAEGRDVRPQAEQLAREQARIAAELESLGQGEDGLLGEPAALAREARELTDRLAAGRVDSETVNRQRGLFRRMLDAGRSLEQDELDTERRESRTGEAILRDVPALDPSLLAGPRFPLPEAAALGRLPPYYRRLVLEYFDRLNEVEAAGLDRPPDQESGEDERAQGREDGRE